MAGKEYPGAFVRNAAGEKMPYYAIAVSIFIISFSVGHGKLFAGQIVPPLAHDPALLATMAFLAVCLMGACNG